MPISDTLNSIFGNKLLMQYLSGAGGAISSGQPIGAALNKITQQSISAQGQAALNKKYIEILSNMLGGKIPEGGSFKLTSDSKGIKHEMFVPKLDPSPEIAADMMSGNFLNPSSSSSVGASDEPGVTTAPAAVSPDIPTPTSAPTPIPTPASTDVASPLTMPDMSASDLAGLSAADVSRALSGALGVAELKQKMRVDPLDAAYKRALIRQIDTGIAAKTPVYVDPATGIGYNVDQYTKLMDLNRKQRKDFTDGVLNSVRALGLIRENAPFYKIPGSDIELTFDQTMDYLKMSREEQDSFVERNLKRARTKKIATEIADSRKIYEVPGVDIKLNRAEYLAFKKLAITERTAAAKNYELAKKEGYEGSFVDFLDMAKTTHMKDYLAAKESGYKGSFHEWLYEMARAGALSVVEVVARKEALGKQDIKQYVASPTGLAKDIAASIGANDFQNDLFIHMEDPNYRSTAIVRLIEGKLATLGEVTPKSWIGNIVTWEIEYPDGTSEEFRYAVGPQPTPK